MLKVGKLIKYLQLTSAWVEMLVHQGKKTYSAVVSCVTLESTNLASAMALQCGGGGDDGQHS